MSVFHKLSLKSFRVLDIFGSEISLNYKKDNLFRTPFGGFVTLVLIAVLVLLFFNNILVLFSKSKVKTVPSTKYDTTPDALTLDRSNFMIATKYDQTNFIDRPLVNITFERRHYIRFENGTYLQKKIPITLEPCTLEHFEKLPSYQVNWTSTFVQQNLTDFLCLKKDETFEVGGRWENDEFKFLKFTVKTCVNKTELSGAWNPICQSKQALAKATNEDSRVQFFVVNYLLQPEKQDNVIQSYLESLILNVQPEKMYSTANIMLNQQTLVTDESIIPIKDLRSQSFPAFLQNDFKAAYSVGNFNNYSQIFFLRSSFSTTIKREFLKIDEVISYMGGFCQIFLLISAIIVSFYNDIVYTIELANKLYDFDLPNDSSKKKKDRYLVSQEGKDHHAHLNNTTTLKKQDSLNLKVIAATNKNTQQNTLNQNQDADQNNTNIASQTKYILNRDILPRSTQIRNQFGLTSLELSKNPSQQLAVQNLQNGETNRKGSNESNGEQYISAPPSNTNRQISNFTDYLESERTTMTNLNGGKRFFLAARQMPRLEILREANLEQSNIEVESNYTSNQNNSKDSPSKVQKMQFDRLDSEGIGNNRSVDKNANTVDYSPIGNLRNSTNAKLDNPKDNLLFKNSFRFKAGNNIEVLAEPQSMNEIRNQGISTEKNEKIDSKKFLESELKQIISRERSIKTSFKFIVNKLSCGKLYDSMEVQLLKKADEKVRQDLDIFMILDRIKEMEKLKNLFLSNEQQILFNFFPKPVIKMDEDQELLSIKTLKNKENQISQINQQDQKKKQKRLQLSLKQLTTVTKAVKKFKKIANNTTSENSEEQNDLSNYQKLFNCYEMLLIESQINPIESIKNNKLFESLGEEMKRIFKAAKLMKDKQLDKHNISFNGLQRQKQQYVDTSSPIVLNRHSLQTTDTFKPSQKSKFQLESVQNLEDNSNQQQLQQEQEQQQYLETEIDQKNRIIVTEKKNENEIVIQQNNNNLIKFDEDLELEEETSSH